MTKVFMHIESGEISLITITSFSGEPEYFIELEGDGFMGQPKDWDDFFEIGDF